MTCTQFDALMDALDCPSLTPDMAAHAVSCPSCAAKAAGYAAALALYRLPELESGIDLAPRINALLPFLPAPRRIVSMRDWLAAGVLLIVSMVLVPLLAEFRLLSASYGSGYTVPLALVLGISVSVYAGLFIISHLEQLAKLLQNTLSPR
jgi:hypothetical protein